MELNIDKQLRFEYVSRQFGATFLSMEPRTFDRYMCESPSVKYQLSFGGKKRYDFNDLARLVFPDATREELILMRVHANILIGGLKNGILGKKEKKSNEANSRSLQVAD